MRNSLFWSLALSISLLAIFTALPCYADDAPLHLVGGGAAPLYSPITTIQMEAEEIIIKLGPKTYTVDATFHFFNSGKTTEEIVGFPKRGMGYGGDFKGVKPFIKFDTWINDIKTNFEEKPDKSTVKGDVYLSDLIATVQANKTNSFFLTDNRWLVKRVTFETRKHTTTRVVYEAEYRELIDGGCLIAYYIYGTGAYWKGPIGKATFIIDEMNKPRDKSVFVRFPIDSDKRYKATIKKKSPTATAYELSPFKPKDEDELSIFIGVCP
jgi:hypothetical protein